MNYLYAQHITEREFRPSMEITQIDMLVGYLVEDREVFRKYFCVDFLFHSSVVGEGEGVEFTDTISRPFEQHVDPRNKTIKNMKTRSYNCKIKHEIIKNEVL